MESNNPTYEELIRDLSPKKAEKAPGNGAKWATLVVLSLALAIIIIDTTILNVSLKTIINDLHTNITSMQWVITAYSLVLASLTITGGRLGDLFGRKAMFMTGAIIFALGSLITSLSNHAGTMIIGEAIIEGIGAALMMPATSSLLVTTFKGKERAIAFGVWGAIAAASSAIGPVLGGWLTSEYSWRWAFRVNVFVVILLLLGSFLIKEARDTEEKPSLDFVGVLLSATGLLSIVFGFIQASIYGWWLMKAPFIFFGNTIDLGGYSPVPLFILFGLIVLALFIAWEKSVENQGQTPLVSTKLFRNRQFTSGMATIGMLTLGMSGLIFSAPVFLQTVRNLDAYHTGLAMLPLSLAVLVAAPLGIFLARVIIPKYVIQLGLLINMAAFITLYYTINASSTANDFILGFALFGFGMGLVMGQINNMTMSAVSPEQAGEASGVSGTLRQVGGTLGSAILGAILISTLGTNLVNGIKTSLVIPAELKPALEENIAQQSSSIAFSGTGNLGGQISPDVAAEIVALSHQATADADKVTLGYGALFSFLGFLVSFTLPNIKHIHTEHSAAAHPASETTVPAQTEAVVEDMPTRRRRRGVNTAGIVALMFVLSILAGLAGYLIGKKSVDDTDKPEQQITTINPVVTQPDNTFPTDNLGTLPSTPTTTTPAPTPPEVPPTSPTNYQNSAWNFAFTAPQAVVATPVSSTQISFYNNTTSSMYGAVARYTNPGVSTLDALRSKINANSSYARVEDTSVNGVPAIRFWQTNGTETVATLYNGILYYIAGPLSENSSFRFL